MAKKKLFISVPMKNRTTENIKLSISKMHQLAEIMTGEEFDIVDSYIENDPPKDSHTAIWYLGESIKKMSEADYFIGIHWSDFWNGCATETDIARKYGIPSILLDTHDCSFLKDAYKLERARWDEAIPVCNTIPKESV